MKKLIALLLAVSSLAMSTSALAASYDAIYVAPIGENESIAEHDGVSRNYTTSSSKDDNDEYNYGSHVFRATSDGIHLLPTYRSGDEITFRIVCTSGGTAVKCNEGDILTFICSKQDDSDYNNYNIQFVDQMILSPDPDTTNIYNTYKLRDNLEDGRYKLEMRLQDTVSGTVISNTYSFLVATPSVELLYVNDVTGKTPSNADKYLLKNGNASCFGKATITAGANFSQVDTDFGFVFNGVYYIKETKRDGNNLIADADDALQASITNGNHQEIGGQAQYFFRMLIEDVYDIDDTELTDDQIINIYNSLPDVNVYLND